MSLFQTIQIPSYMHTEKEDNKNKRYNRYYYFLLA